MEYPMNGNDVYDIVLLGGGPAGLTASLYAARARFKCVLVEKLGLGGQLLTYEKVDNYPGFPEGVTAFELVELFSTQAKRFGMEHRSGEVRALELDGELKAVHLDTGTLFAKSVVIATGCSPRKLNVKGERAFTGRGVSYCAVCDGPFYREMEVAVVGGGDTAVEEAVYLTKFATRVHIIHRRGDFRAIRVIQEEAERNDKITFHLNRIVTEIQGGDQGVERLILQDVQSGATTPLDVPGVFIFVGLIPNADFIPPEVARDAQGFIVTDTEMATSVPGVFAAGDIRSKALRQIVTAVGDGATAAFNAGRYVESLNHKA
jgi:thioredoxin reductase (NADPH)